MLYKNSISKTFYNRKKLDPLPGQFLWDSASIRAYSQNIIINVHRNFTILTIKSLITMILRLMLLIRSYKMLPDLQPNKLRMF